MVDSTTSYINTLIFCIIAKATSLVLFIALITDIGWRFSYLILTIEVGLFVIIGTTLYKIYAYQKAIDEAAAAASKAPAILNACPDYFVQTVQEDSHDIICQNGYTTPDNKHIYKFTTGSSTGANVPTQNISQITNGVKTLSELCTAQTTPIEGFSWSDLKGRCGLLDTSI